MPKIHVNKAFTLQYDPGAIKDGNAKKHFPKGVHEVSDYEANHWFVQAHSEALTGAVAVPVSPPPPVEKEKK